MCIFRHRYLKRRQEIRPLDPVGMSTQSSQKRQNVRTLVSWEKVSLRIDLTSLLARLKWPTVIYVCSFGFAYKAILKLFDFRWIRIETIFDCRIKWYCYKEARIPESFCFEIQNTHFNCRYFTKHQHYQNSGPWARSEKEKIQDKQILVSRNKLSWRKHLPSKTQD